MLDTLQHVLEKLINPVGKTSVELMREKDSILAELRNEGQQIIYEYTDKFYKLQESISIRSECIPTLENRRKVLTEDIKKLESQLEKLKVNNNEYIESLKSKALERLENHRLRSENEVERAILYAEKTLESKLEMMLSKRVQAITLPLIQENRELKYRLVNSGLVNNGDSTNKVSNIDCLFLDSFLVNLKDDILRPQHLRLSGPSESGKSHLINNLIAYYRSKFKSLEICLCDPYESESDWDVSPKSFDPESTIDELERACEIVDNGNIKGYRLLIIDEIDTLAADNPCVLEMIKKLWKRGRHKGIYLWLLGQNANVKHLKLQLNDLKNVHAIHIGDCGLDYLNSANYLKRDKKDLMLLLEGTLQDNKYTCVVIPKGKNGIIKGMPEKLDLNQNKKVVSITANNKDKPDCKHCGSSRVVKNGKKDNVQLYLCNECKRQFLETSIRVSNNG